MLGHRHVYAKRVSLVHCAPSTLTTVTELFVKKAARASMTSTHTRANVWSDTQVDEIFFAVQSVRHFKFESIRSNFSFLIDSVQYLQYR